MRWLLFHNHFPLLHFTALMIFHFILFFVHFIFCFYNWTMLFCAFSFIGFCLQIFMICFAFFFFGVGFSPAYCHCAYVVRATRWFQYCTFSFTNVHMWLYPYIWVHMSVIISIHKYDNMWHVVMLLQRHFGFILFWLLP